MPVVYADSSALLRAYFADEPEHQVMRTRVVDGQEAIFTSELSCIEMTAAVRSAARHGRIPDGDDLLARIMQDMLPGGPLGLIGLDSDRVVGRARQLCDRHRLRTLDAIHLAVALGDARELADGEGLVFLTRDADQAEAARLEGLLVE